MTEWQKERIEKECAFLRGILQRPLTIGERGDIVIKHLWPVESRKAYDRAERKYDNRLRGQL